MANEHTGTDSLRYRLTGASAHNGTQSDPDASLGNHASSTFVASIEAVDMNPSLGSCPITIERIGPKTTIGNGTLTATGDDTVTWTPPGDTVGPDVTILNGETRLIPGNDPDLYIVITRDSATAMTSSTVVATVQVYPNVWAGRDISETERTNGITLYRCVCVENMSAVTVNAIKALQKTLGTQRTCDVQQLGASGSGSIETTGSFSDWPSAGWCLIRDSGGTVREAVLYSSRTDTVLTVPTGGRGLLGTTAAAGAATDTVDAIPGMRIGIEPPASQPSGAFSQIADEETAPGGVTFSLALLTSEALSIGNLDANEIYAVWLEIEIPAGMVSGSAYAMPVRVLGEAA